jgi:predicted nucleotidyltransferase
MRAREGDFVETSDQLFFDVKGLLHPPERVVAYLRYYPDNQGDRLRDGVRYAKVYELSKRRLLLEKRWPHYLYYDEVQGRKLQAVPLERILNLHMPSQGLATLGAEQKDSLQVDALELIEVLIRESGVPRNCFGISGSLLIHLHSPESDIDVVVYGKAAAKRVQEALFNLLEEGKQFQRYKKHDLEGLYVRRGLRRAIRLKDFILQERHKAFQGKFMRRDYFIRCVKSWEEIADHYGDARYRALGRCTISAMVKDDEEGLLTPCRYLLERVRVLAGIRSRLPIEIVSFRGRFAEQARVGEKIVACGRLESVHSRGSEHFRLVVGEGSRDILMKSG